MLERIAGLTDELRDVEIRLGDPAVQSDPRRLAELGRRHKQLSEIVATGERLRSVQDDLDEAHRMHSAADAADRAELREMIDELEAVVAETDRGAEGSAAPARPERGTQRDRRDSRRGRRRGGQPVRPRPVRHVPGLRQAAALEAGAAGRFAVGPRGIHRGERAHLRSSGLDPHEARSGHPPGAAGSGHRVAGPGPHIVSHGVGAARGRGSGCADRRVRPADRCLPIVGSRWPVGEHHRLGGAGHPRAQRHRGGHAGREEPAPEQAEGTAGAAVEAACRPSRSGPRPSSRPCAGARWAAATGPRRSAPTT